MSITLDVSNYDLQTFDAACLKAEGVDRVIVGCQRPDMAREMVTRAQAAGIDVMGVYAFLYFGLDSIGQTDAAIEVAKEFGIKRVWLDVESRPPHEADGLVPGQRMTELTTCVGRVERAGLEPGIYTGRWYWVPYMGNTTEFSHLPLWHAAYGPGGSPADPEPEVAYGGWTKVAIHQYTSTLFVCGRNRDANYVFEEDDMPDPALLARIETLEGQVLRLENLVAANGYRTPAGILTGEQAMDAADSDGGSLFLGLGDLQALVAQGYTPPPHSHELEPMEVWRTGPPIQ